MEFENLTDTIRERLFAAATCLIAMKLFPKLDSAATRLEKNQKDCLEIIKKINDEFKNPFFEKNSKLKKLKSTINLFIESIDENDDYYSYRFYNSLLSIYNILVSMHTSDEKELDLHIFRINIILDKFYK